MTQPVITAEPNESLAVAAKRMREHGIGSVVVVQQGRPIGILTERDLLRAAASAATPAPASVREWMASEPDCVDADTSVDEAWRTRSDTGSRHTPVHVGDQH